MIKYFKIIVILCVFIAVGCNSNKIDKPKKPKNLIKKQDMVNILYDMTILSASKRIDAKLLERNGILPEDVVYEKYKIDSTQFVLSNEYYAYDLEAYKEMFDQVKIRLEKQSKVLDSVKNLEAEERKNQRSQQDTTNKVDQKTIIPSRKIDTSQLDTRQ